MQEEIDLYKAAFYTSYLKVGHRIHTKIDYNKNTKVTLQNRIIVLFEIPSSINTMVGERTRNDNYQ